MSKNMKIEVLPDGKGKGDWTWRLVAANGRAIEPSSTRKARAIEIAKKIALGELDVVVKEA